MSLIRTFGRFTLCGGLATGIQCLILIVLSGGLAVPPTPASATGYVISAFVNYALNRRYTFTSGTRHVEALPRFLTVAVVGLLLNSAIMSPVTVLLSLHYLPAQLIATCCVLVWNFTVNRFWTFGRNA